MNSFKILLKKDFLELHRSKKWLVYIICFTIITLFSVISARLLPEILNLAIEETGIFEEFKYKVSVADSYMQFISNIGQICLLLILIMFSYTLNKEKNTGTYYMLKSNGVQEYKVVLSHFVSKLILISVSYLISIGVFALLNLALFKEYAGIRGVVSLTYLYLTLIFALCLGLFVSSITKKKSNGVVISIVIYFILTILSIFPYINIYNPLYSLTLATDLIVTLEYTLSDYLINLFMILAISIALLGTSIYLFKNKIDNRK